MQTLNLDPQNMFQAASAIPADTPIVMLNLLRYKEQADYGDRPEFPSCSGKEAYYQRYVPAFAKAAALSENEKAFKLAFLATVLSSLVGPADEPWDDAVLVEYTNFAAFRTIVESPGYRRDADPHRKAALANWRLIAMARQTLS